MEWYKDGMYPEWHLDGTNFSPKKLQSLFPELILRNSKEKTDIATRGRFKGSEYGYGSTQIVVDDSITDKFDWLLNFIIENSNRIRNLGVEDEIIWIYWYGIQGNMEMDKEIIKKLSETNLDMAMNYIYIDSENE